jgi:hypothetical protein
LENGNPRARYKPGDVEILARTYGADPETVDVLSALARLTKGHTWFSSYRDPLPHGFAMYVELEALANHVLCYDSELIPGLLETEDYARRIFGSRRVLSNAQVRQRTALRMARQSLLTRRVPPAARFEFFLDEAVLRRVIGGPDVFAGQLRRLLDVGRLANVSIRVLPLAGGMHLGLDTGRFQMLDFPRHSRLAGPPTTVFLEPLTSEGYVDHPDEVAPYRETLDDLVERALDEQTSRQLIERISRSLDAGDL